MFQKEFIDSLMERVKTDDSQDKNSQVLPGIFAEIQERLEADEKEEN